MDKKDINYIEDSFNELLCETETLMTLSDVLSMAANSIDLSQNQQTCTFEALKTLANNLYTRVDDLQETFFRLTKWGE